MHPGLYGECRTVYGSVLVAAGRWVEADRELAEALRITAGACPRLHTRALARVVDLRIRQGRLEEADLLLAELDGRLHTETEAILSRAALLLARGDASGASSLLIRRLRTVSRHRSLASAALEVQFEAQLAAGDLDGAVATARRLTKLAGSASTDRIGAAAATARGRVALARGDRDTAINALEGAVALWSRLELPFEHARARFELGRALGASQPDLAIESARGALMTFERLGAAIDADRVAAFLRSLGVVARVGPKGVGTLTVREQDVLHLLGVGLSNPEIAQRLHVSRKTAAHHVSSILTKLNLRNRAEAAAYAVREA